MEFDMSGLVDNLEEIQEVNWQNLHFSFTPQLTQFWLDRNFTYQQAQEWINIGLTPQDYEFTHFLKNIKQLTAEQTLNYHNLENLKSEFEQYKQSNQQTQQPSKTDLIEESVCRVSFCNNDSLSEKIYYQNKKY